MQGLAARGVAFVVLYVGLALLPLWIAVTGTPPPARSFLVEFSVALGFVGLSMMSLQFALVARFKAVAAPFGQDALLGFHKQMSFWALGFVLAHPLLLVLHDVGKYLPLFNPVTAPWRARFALTSVVCLLVLTALSVWRKRLKLSYEIWQVSHGVLAVVIVAAALLHINGVSYYVDGPVKRVLWTVMSVVLVGLLGWVRIVKPVLRLRRPWRVVRVEPQLGRSTTMVIEPVGHPGLSFLPGQFAWVIVGGSPFAVTQHPFSFSHAGDVPPGGQVALTIKQRGDFTNRIPSLEPGTRVYVDGPHGVFTPDLHEGPGFVLVAGGVGVTPMHSILATMAERGDVRPVVFFYANKDWDAVTFREEFADLAGHTNLTMVHVLEDAPDPRPDGPFVIEEGRIDAALLQRHLPERARRFPVFICGPGPMMDAMEDAFAALGFPPANVHTERFDMV